MRGKAQDGEAGERGRRGGREKTEAAKTSIALKPSRESKGGKKNFLLAPPFSFFTSTRRLASCLRSSPMMSRGAIAGEKRAEKRAEEKIRKRENGSLSLSLSLFSRRRLFDDEWRRSTSSPLSLSLSLSFSPALSKAWQRGACCQVRLSSFALSPSLTLSFAVDRLRKHASGRCARSSRPLSSGTLPLHQSRLRRR